MANEPSSNGERPGDNVIHLQGMEARAVIAAVEKAVARVEVSVGHADRSERAAWAAKAAADGAKAAAERAERAFLESRRDSVKKADLEPLARKVDLEALADQVANNVYRLQQADRRIEGKVQLGRVLAQESSSVTAHTHVSRRLPGLEDDEWSEITHNTLLKHVLERGQKDAEFQRQVVQAHVGLKVYTTKQILKWVGLAVAAAIPLLAGVVKLVMWLLAH